MSRAMFATLALVSGIASADEPDVPTLVGLLSSARPAERDEAALSLAELGADVLPALRDAARDADDEQTRASARALIDRVEGALLAEPTRVALDLDGVPLAEAVATLSDRVGVTIVLDPGDGPDPSGRPVTLATPGPVPFWEALHLLCDAGRVRHDPGRGLGELAASRPTIRLVDGDPPGWTIVRGPFRVHLARLSYESVAEAARGPTASTPPRRVLTAEVQVFAEPRLFLDADGHPEVEAIAEDGLPLPPPPIDDAARTLPGLYPRATPGGLSLVEYPVPLGVPEPRPGRLRMLRGTIPVLVSARHGEPIEIPLDGPLGEPARGRAATIRVDRLNASGRQPGITVAIIPADPPEGLPTADLPGESTGDRIGPTDLVRHRIEVVDASGAPLRTSVGFAGTAQDGAWLWSVAISGTPARLRYHDLVATQVGIEFEFREVPLP